MDNDKSILEKFTDTVKGIASTAADAASAALKAEEPPLRDNDLVAVPLPPGAAGLVSDPMLVPPIAAPAPRRRKRAPAKRSAGKPRTAAKKAGKKAVKRSAKKATKKTAKKSTRKAAKKSAVRKSNRKSKATMKRPKATVKKRRTTRRR